MSQMIGNQLTLIDLKIKPCAYIQDVIEGSVKKLREGTEDSGGRLVYCFKIAGENRIIAIISGDSEAATLLQSKAYGELTEVCCTLLRTYEAFARDFLGIQKSLTDLLKKTENRDKLLSDSPGDLFWLVMNCDNSGMPTQDFTKTSTEQATFMLGLRNSGQLDIDLYKAECTHKIHAFVKAQSADVLDDLILACPVARQQAGRLEVQLKQVLLWK